MLFPSQQTVEDIFQTLHLPLIDNCVRHEPLLLAQSQSASPLHHQDGKFGRALYTGHENVAEEDATGF